MQFTVLIRHPQRFLAVRIERSLDIPGNIVRLYILGVESNHMRRIVTVTGIDFLQGDGYPAFGPGLVLLGFIRNGMLKILKD